MHKLVLVLVVLTACGKKASKPKVHDAGHADVDVVPTATEPPGIRLPDGVTPLAYRVALEVDPTQGSFAGTAEIDVVLAAPSPAIWLHAAADLKIASADAVRGAATSSLSITRGKHERIALTAAGEHPAGPATLKFTFTGVQDPERTNGLRRREDRGDWYVVSQLEAEGARRVFPSLDEPRWKVPFQLTLTVPAGVMALSNSPVEGEQVGADGRKTVTFAATPPLPTYLVAVAVGPFEAVDAGKSKTGTPIRIIVPKGRAADAAFAAAELPKIQAALEDYTGSPYPYAKLDHLVIPSQPRGAMENPGLITYPPRYLLVTPDETLAAKAVVVGLGAHELAHQWFGNLVTMSWWDDIWLNEAFATWASAKFVAQLYPELGGLSVAADQRRTALDADGKASARKIRQPVTNAAELDAAFDGITYQKGATVLRMFERWLGEDVFQRGVRAYLAKHAWGHASTADFLAAIDAASGQDVTRPFSTFLDQPGAPVIEMEVDCPEGGQAKLLLHQRRHLLLGANDAGPKPRWQIPVCIRTSEVAEPACTLLAADDGAIDLGTRCPTWVAPNAAGVGYYRSALAPPHDRALLTAPVAPAELAAAAVDLALAVDAGEVGLDRLVAAIPAFGASQERVIREIAVARLESFAPIVSEADRPAYAALVTRTFGKAAFAIGWRPTPDDTIADATLRGRIVALAATQGADRADTAGVAQWTAAIVRTWFDERSIVPVSLWSQLLGAAVRSRPDEVFERMLGLATSEPDPAARRAMLGAVAEVEDVASKQRVLDLLLADDPIPFERLAVLGGAHNPATQAAVFDYLEANQAALLTRLGDDWHGRLVYAPCLEDRRDEIAAWLTKELAPRDEIGQLPVTQAIEAMDQCLAVRSSLAPQLAAALQSPP